MKNKSSAIIGTFTGKCSDFAVVNNNEMHLGKELFEKLLASETYKRAMKYRHYIGFLGHPEDPGCMDYKDACIVMTEMHIEPNGDVIGTFDLIDTPVGRVVKVFMDAGVIWGISIRGAGDVAADGEVDPDSFVFRGFDLVTFPAYDDAIPTFQQIAASSDLDKQVKYKKVCTTLHNNLQGITSCEALEVIQSQFNPNSSEYAEIEARKNAITEEIEEDETSSNDTVLAQKLEAMTQLYLEQVTANQKLQQDNIALGVELQQTKLQCSKKLNAVKRITSSQVADLSTKLKKITASYRTSVAANSKLKSELESATNANLKYTHKIEANSQAICQKDSIISNLKKELSETVTASRTVEKRASNLDDKNRNLIARVEAAEQMVLNYQQAYANMYANALGVHLEGLSISASTSVEQLRDMINGGTSTCNMSAGLANDMAPVELLEGDYNEDDIVTI